jgi:hypothetical protein
VSDDMRAFAAQHGWHAPRQDREFEKFRQHALQTGRLLKDWVAGWRSWVLKGTEFDGAKTRIAEVPVSTVNSAPVDWNSRVTKFKTGGLWPLPWGPQPGFRRLQGAARCTRSAWVRLDRSWLCPK